MDEKRVRTAPEIATRTEGAPTTDVAGPKEVAERTEDAVRVAGTGQPHPSASVSPAVRQQVHLWVEQFGAGLVRYARAAVGDEELALDLVQETLLSASKAFHSFEGRSSPRAWLTTILRNKIRDYGRKKREVGEGVLAPPPDSSGSFSLGSFAAIRRGNSWDDSPEQTARQHEFFEVLTGCLAKLPATTRAAFLMREVEELELAEIAQELGITEGNLRVMLYRARAALRQCLSANWFTE